MGAKSKGAVLTKWLRHFCDVWHLNALITHSDKDSTEINSLANVWPGAKHQLCFWHVLRAVKKRLAGLHHQPAYYDVTCAGKEFMFIDPLFVPIAQCINLSEADVRPLIDINHCIAYL